MMGETTDEKTDRLVCWMGDQWFAAIATGKRQARFAFVAGIVIGAALGYYII